MRIFTIVTASFALFAVACTENGDKEFLQINKCCPRNQMLDEQLNCVELDFEEEKLYGPETSKRSLPWFPIETIVDSKTLKVHEHESDKYLRMIEANYSINYGVKPQCSDSDTKQFAYHRTDMVEWFNFVVDERGAMKIHISKPSSFHSPENILLFSKIDNETEAYPISYDKGSIRSLPLGDTCVDLGIHQIYVLMFCPCHTMLCVRKCCAEDQYFSIESFGCEENENEMDKIQDWRPVMDGLSENYYLLSDTYPSCDIPILLKYHHEEYSSCNRFNRVSDNEFTIFPNGSLKVRKYSTLFDTTQYCGEVTVSENGTIERQNLILCSASKKEEDAYEPITHTLYGVLLIVGGICLFLTVVVSLYLPSLRRKVHNKIALSHNASLMMANFTWSVPQLSTGLSPKSCIILAFLEQFMLLGSFFWLNVMCIDISLTFSSNRHLKKGGLDGGTKKFLYYCFYAWGMTSIVSIITLAMEYSTDANFDYLKPGFACICGFNTANASMLLYLYGPMTILLVVNLMLFIYTTAKIMSIQKQTAVLHKTDSNTTGGSSFQTDKQRYDFIQWLILYGKLFLLMGITWIMEIISWAVGGPSYYWYFSDMLNLLRAVFIFILFICKKQVMRNLKKKWKKKVQGLSDKTGSAKSQTDEEAVSTTAHMGTGASRRKGSGKSETELPKNGRHKGYCNPSTVKESQM